MDVTHPQLVAALVKPPLDIINSLSPTTVDLWHGATGVAGECGELLEGIALTRQVHLSEAALVEARGNVLEESGDIYFYVEQVIQRTGIELDWDSMEAFAGQQHIGPDAMLTYAVHIAVGGSQVLDTVKKAAVYNKPLDTALLKEQISFTVRFVLTIGLMFGFSREQALNSNIIKLKKRYDGLAYTDQAAQDRADKKPTSQGETVPGYTPPERKHFGQEPALNQPVRIPAGRAEEKSEAKEL